MQPISRTSVYNLKAVLKETGLTADVLRAWERRYGLPQPQRTQGRQRLYSQYDIALVKWLRARQAEGLSISRAVEQWKESVKAGHDPLADFLTVGSSIIPQPLAASETQVEMLLRRWLEACLGFDEAAANQALNQAFSLYPVEMVCMEIIRRGLSLIGDRWYQGEASVQQEHFASALAARRLETLIASTPSPTRGQTVLVGCPPGEFHAFPALLLTLLLRRRGLNLVYLGADIPAEWLTDAVTAIRPDLVVLAAQQLTTAASLRQLAIQLQAQGIQTAYGGWIFNHTPALRERIPAHFLGETIDTALENIDLLIAHPLPAPEIAEVPGPLAAAHRAFRQQRALIEAEVFTSMQAQGLSTEQLSAANAFLGADLTAALDLGDLSAMAAEFEWISGRMAQQNMSPAQLPSYLAAYQQAIMKVIGVESNAINDWIAHFVSR